MPVNFGGRNSPAERLIVKDALGRDVFFPWGQRSSGYILPDRQTGERARRFLARFPTIWLWGAMLSCILVSQWAGLTGGMLAGLIFFGIYLFVYGSFVYFIIRGKRKTAETYQQLAAHRAPPGTPGP